MVPGDVAGGRAARTDGAAGRPYATIVVRAPAGVTVSARKVP
jgi:hypothetical protein